MIIGENAEDDGSLLINEPESRIPQGQIRTAGGGQTQEAYNDKLSQSKLVTSQIDKSKQIKTGVPISVATSLATANSASSSGPQKP